MKTIIIILGTIFVLFQSQASEVVTTRTMRRSELNTLPRTMVNAFISYATYQDLVDDEKGLKFRTHEELEDEFLAKSMLLSNQNKIIIKEVSLNKEAIGFFCGEVTEESVLIKYAIPFVQTDLDDRNVIDVMLRAIIKEHLSKKIQVVEPRCDIHPDDVSIFIKNGFTPTKATGFIFKRSPRPLIAAKKPKRLAAIMARKSIQHGVACGKNSKR